MIFRELTDGFPIKKELTPINTEKIFQSLKNISENLEKASHYVTSEERIKNIGIVSGLIQTHFAKKDPSLLGHGPGLYLDLLNALKRSTVETSRYEFKQGILKLSDDRKIDENHIDNIVSTICGIANTGPDSPGGFIYIGIADKKEDAERIKTLDQVNFETENSKYIVGIEREAKTLSKTLDQYIYLLVDRIKRSKLTEELKTDVLSRIDVVDFKQLNVIRISIPTQKQISFVGSKCFHREGSSTIESSGLQISTITKRFNQ